MKDNELSAKGANITAGILRGVEVYHLQHYLLYFRCSNTKRPHILHGLYMRAYNFLWKGD